MTEAKNIPYLLALLDDPSPVVQAAVAREFAAFAATLDAELGRLPDPPTAEQRAAIRRVVADHARNVLRETWPSWWDLKDEYEKIERAFALLADFFGGPGAGDEWLQKLGLLALEFQGRENAPEGAEALARFLFAEKGLKGERSDYYNPRNSDLAHVLHSGQGLPISLACIYVLVGRRIGLDISGCNWPGHFLARIFVEGELMLVDCFNDGHCISVDSFLKMQGPSRNAARTLLDTPADAATIMGRVLSNLVAAYTKLGKIEESELMQDLLRHIEQRQLSRPER